MRSLQRTAITRKRKGDVSVLERVIYEYFNSIREDRDQNIWQKISLTVTFCAPRDPTELHTFIICLHLDVFDIKSCLDS